jgi:hypothetical protein
MSWLRTRGAILSLPQYVFMAWYFVMHRDNFTSYQSTVVEYKKDVKVKVKLSLCFN